MTQKQNAVPAPAAIRIIENAPPGAPFVVAQLGQSLDGRIATPTGESRWINGDAALDHLHAVRAAVDAVVVGVGTAIADNPRLNVRRVPRRAGRPPPARVVIDSRGRMPVGMTCLDASDGARCIRIVRDDTQPETECPEEIMRLHAVDGFIPPEDIVSALHARGLSRLLIEGGAATVSSFLDADLLDRLHVLVAPIIIGSGKTGFDLKPIDRLAQARRPNAQVHVLADGDVLFDCDLRSGAD